MTKQLDAQHQIYFDEAGNTGAALLDLDQPTFTLASCNYQIDEAESLLVCVASRQSPEIKFKSLKKSLAGQNKLIKFFNQSELLLSRVKLSEIHKKYMAIGKIVDTIIEPMVKEDGIDLYDKGQNIALSNLLYAVGPVFCPDQQFDSFINSFIAMLRENSVDTRTHFLTEGGKLFNACSNASFQPILAPFITCAPQLETFISNLTFNHIDPAITSFISHSVAWGDQLGAVFDAIHDESKPMASERDTIMRFANQNIDQAIVGYDRRQFSFPFMINNIHFRDSKVIPQLQISDLFASALSFISKSELAQIQNPFANRLLAETDLERFVISRVWPSDKITPQELGTDGANQSNHLDHIVDNLLDE